MWSRMVLVNTGRQLRRLRMLGNMGHVLGKAGPVAKHLRMAMALATCAWVSATAGAQTCTTQARMTALQRGEVGSAAFGLASAVQAGDTARVATATVSNYSGDANQTAYLVRSTGARIAADALTVTQVYLLDASSRSATDTAQAEFACPLAGATNETDFGIAGLPPGRYAFAMVACLFAAAGRVLLEDGWLLPTPSCGGWA